MFNMCLELINLLNKIWARSHVIFNGNFPNKSPRAGEEKPTTCQQMSNCPDTRAALSVAAILLFYISEQSACLQLYCMPA